MANAEISKESIWLMPLLLLTIPSQVPETVLAKGVIAPNPVITTRRVLNVIYRKEIKKKAGSKRACEDQLCLVRWASLPLYPSYTITFCFDAVVT